ncbi:4Fe-4S binding protein [Methanococcoides burtonii]|uniref:4Fe-4S ferredoxin, iron-sulfur binding protein n=1 Tax=Methanococcoides burtonii (strain DSM 6242 / NBRC 107633 / OCM 468 / ACE-M) TaxID=259564 RepID=Q12Z14_METBU|nr:4Fe-4S binding protein [Methanococcoides burtonii]ABE51312.1 4Fe-4S ferredoxin, iron-sulfur binding protein [Methanococcoides burtonii DSM 6242]
MKIKISIESAIVAKPILAEAIIETGALLNISQAHYDTTHGEVVADIPSEQFGKIRDSLVKKGAEVVVLDTPISRDEEECVECGACISVCPVGVFSFADDWSLEVDTDKCIQCGTCLTMCPHNALVLGQ